MKGPISQLDEARIKLWAHMLKMCRDDDERKRRILNQAWQVGGTDYVARVVSLADEATAKFERESAERWRRIEELENEMRKRWERFQWLALGILAIAVVAMTLGALAGK